jgi:hypothetical protein
MLARTRLLRRGLAVALSLLLVGLVSAAEDDKPKKDKEPPDPPGTTIYMDQFRALFDAWDENSDGFLDKDELAHAFRGDKAKPFDTPKADTKKDDSTSDSKDTKKPDYTKYADYNFLVALDQDNDQKVSRKEFLSWARNYAVALKQQADAQNKLSQLQTKLNGLNVKSKGYKTAQNQVAAQAVVVQQQTDKANAFLKGFEKGWAQGLAKLNAKKQQQD